MVLRTGEAAQTGTTSDFGRAWLCWATLGELVGFVVPAGLGAAATNWPNAAAAATLALAGIAEGGALGAAQAHVWRTRLPGLGAGRYALATGLAAAVAYVIGMTPAVAGERLWALPWWLLGLLAALGGAALLASIGTAQWLVLRRVLPGSASWVATTALAWVAGLGAFVAVGTPLWQPGQPLLLTALIGVLAGAAMAVVVAAVTGLAAARLLRRHGLLPPAGG